MTTIQINTTETMTYNPAESARAFAMVERLAAIGVLVVSAARRAVRAADPHLVSHGGAVHP
jgi:hypothetical protein